MIQYTKEPITGPGGEMLGQIHTKEGWQLIKCPECQIMDAIVYTDSPKGQTDFKCANGHRWTVED